MKTKIILALVVAACFGFLLACSSDPEETPKYTVSFDLNLPTTGMVGVTAADKPAAITVEQGKTVTLPAIITKSTSHTHTGWFAAKSGGVALTSPYTPGNSITLYAQWTAKGGGEKWTVSFDPTGTDVTLTSATTIASIQVTKGQSATQSGATWPSNPVSSSHNFGGWYKTTDTSQTTAYTTSTAITEDLSLKAKWTEKGPAPTSAPVKVGAVTQDVTVTASTGATATYIENGYEVVITNYGTYAWFKVNLGADKKIGNFMQVKFDFEAIQGDIAYKTYYLLVSDNEFPTSLNNAYESLRVSGFRWWQGTGSAEITCTIGEIQTATTPTNVSANVAASNANEVYVCVYLHAEGTGDQGGAGSATTFSVKNIEFVPAPDYMAATNITGVPDVGEINQELDLTVASVIPTAATNKTIVWSIKNAGTTGVTTITDGKFTPTATGTIIVTATIADGATATTPFIKDFEIAIRSTPEEKQIALTDMAGGYSGTLDADGSGFTVTGGCNYEWSAATFKLNLGTAELKDVAKVTFNYTPLAGDFNFKPIYFAATTKDGTLSGQLSLPTNGYLGTVQTGNTTLNTATSLEIVLDYTLANAIAGSEVQVAFAVAADSAKDGATTSFKIDNIKFWVAE